MTQCDALLHVFAATVKDGGGIHTTAELAFMLRRPHDQAFRKCLADACRSGRIRRVVNGIYESQVTPPDASTAIYKIIKKIRRGVLNYISLESQLSYTGDISQQVMGVVSVMTKGRAGRFETPYGVIELTHMKKPVSAIMPNLYFDRDIEMYRANRPQAIADLKACRRNLHMLENEA